MTSNVMGTLITLTVIATIIVVMSSTLGAMDEAFDESSFESATEDSEPALGPDERAAFRNTLLGGVGFVMSVVGGRGIKKAVAPAVASRAGVTP